ncbi:MAG TPA: hypothetical protein PLV32_13320, partial [Chitinophagaceae bacterium]|nr:hypothetical protein [Chitinophagaceae bacterium]
VSIVGIDDITEGQLCTVLAAREYFANNSGVLVASSDALVIGDMLPEIERVGDMLGGVISVMSLPGDQWSFAKADESGRVTEVAEKTRISDHASTGLYYFSSGNDLLRYADEMILHNERTRGEFYVMPVYNKFIRDNAKVVISGAKGMWDMGTPDAKRVFENNIEIIKKQMNGPY